MPKFTLDGKEIACDPGTTILQAALRENRQLPHYCYHPKLSIAGNCRICLVEVEKAPKLLIACSTVVTEGIVVRTASPKAVEGRRGVMEFLLINHPLDCPICDQAGECRLQEYSVAHGSGESRFIEEKVHKRKRVEIGPHVLLDEERCILCTRCIRFCQEITETSELDLFNRGDQVTIGTFPERQLDNPYSGNVVDICPVGALTSREFRFRSRVWFLKHTASICPGCARGCNIWVDCAGEEVARLRPRVNEAVNSHWICDTGRNGFEYINREDRLLSSLVKKDGALAPTPWKEAVDAVAGKLARIYKESGGEGIGWVVSGRLTNEEAFLVTRICRELLEGSRIAVLDHLEGKDDSLLLRQDRTPNRHGLANFGLGNGKAGDAITELVAALEKGSLRALIVLREDPAGDDTPIPFPEDRLANLDLLMVQDLFLTRTAALADVVFPAASFAEMDGTYTNFEGRVQRIRTAKSAPGAGQAGWMLLTLLGRALEGDFPYGTAEEVTAAIGEKISAYRGLSFATVGDQGMPQSAEKGDSP